MQIKGLFSDLSTLGNFCISCGNLPQCCEILEKIKKNTDPIAKFLEVSLFQFECPQQLLHEDFQAFLEARLRDY